MFLRRTFVFEESENLVIKALLYLPLNRMNKRHQAELLEIVALHG
jgi:hypothetical protein